MSKIKDAKATWGKIKNYDKLSFEHRKMLNENLNPIYRPIKFTFEAKKHEYFIQKNNTVRTYENE